MIKPKLWHFQPQGQAWSPELKAIKLRALSFKAELQPPHPYHLFFHKNTSLAHSGTSALLSFRPEAKTQTPRRRPKLYRRFKAIAKLAFRRQAPLLWTALFKFLPPLMAWDYYSETLISQGPLPRSFKRQSNEIDLFWTFVATLGKTKYQARQAQVYGPHTSSFFLKYLVGFTETTLGGKVCLTFLPYDAQKPELAPSLACVESCVYPRLRRFHRLFFVKDFVDLMAMAFYQKNAALFLRWVVKFMERIAPRLHRKFLAFFKLFLTRLYVRHAPTLGYIGFKLTVKGKISVTGNAKKRTQRVHCGTCSLTTKVNRISYAARVVHTPTGVLGLKCFIFY